MNDTRVLQTTTPKDVRAYVARVRLALSDLPCEDADELTQGMEADLLELAAEAGGLRARLGTPETYADDLRAAADLPPRRAGRTPSQRPVRSGIARWWARGESLMARPWAADLRPVGWVLRGFVGYCLVAYFIGGNLHSLLGWTVGAALSFWVGRATRTWKHRRRTVLVAINLSAALIGIFVVPSVFNQTTTGPSIIEGPPTMEGLARNGEPVTGIVVYDSTGRRVEQPRAFDQNGSPLLTPPDGESYTPPVSLPPLTQQTPASSATAVPPVPLATTPPTASAPPPASTKRDVTPSSGSGADRTGAPQPSSPAAATKRP